MPKIRNRNTPYPRTIKSLLEESSKFKSKGSKTTKKRYTKALMAMVCIIRSFTVDSEYGCLNSLTNLFLSRNYSFYFGTLRGKHLLTIRHALVKFCHCTQLGPLACFQLSSQVQLFNTYTRILFFRKIQSSILTEF